jgi:hypothetical protein
MIDGGSRTAQGAQQAICQNLVVFGYQNAHQGLLVWVSQM